MSETMQKVIQIHVTPHKPTIEKMVGSVDSKTGEFKGNKNHKRTVYPPQQFIPYTYNAYVKRVLNKAGVFEGEIKFLDKKEAGGENMDLRFLSSCPSLCKKYQEDHKYTPSSDKDGVGEFYQGQRIYDLPIETTNELFRLFMLHHPNNGDNENRPKDAPIYFKIRNGKADVDARLNRIKNEKSISDFKLSIVEDDNVAEILSIIYKMNPSYELNSRKELILLKFDEVGGAEKVLRKMNEYFEDMGNRFQFFIDKNVIEIIDEKIILKADKKDVGIKSKFGVDENLYRSVFLNRIKGSHIILSQWIEFEKQLNNNLK